MRILESRLEWNVSRKPREKRGPVRDGDGAPGLLLRPLGGHEALVLFDAVERTWRQPYCTYVPRGMFAGADTGGNEAMPTS